MATVQEKTAVHSVVTYRCMAPDCEETHVEEQSSWLDWELYKLRCPPGWRAYFGAIFCPRHTITMKIDDGEEIVIR
jgi:hypothetical protein